MSTSLKIIIPLLSKNFTKIILSKKAGFIDAFSDDINKPYLDDHIFFMYDITQKTTKETFKRIAMFKKEGLKSYVYEDNGKLYEIYAMPIISSCVRKFKNTGYPIFSNVDKINIGKFWNEEDTYINEFISNPYHCTPMFEHTYITEMADAINPIFDKKNTLTSSLTVTSECI